MSFSRQVKKEIASREIESPCCAAAASYGVACFGRYFDARGIVLRTEQAFIAQWAKTMYTAAGIRGQVFAKGAEGCRSYEFAVKDPFEVEKLLAGFGHTGEETALRIRRENFLCEGCFAAFLAAAFLCCGTIVDPKKGYQLEFVHSRFSLMRDFGAMLAEHGFTPGRAQRNGANVLYVKASEQIEDLLTMMGASQSALEIMNLKVYRDIRNKVNRITNCETANIDKMVAAGNEAIRAIAVLEQHGALQDLSPEMQEAALLRRQNPALSLAELAAMATTPVSKSGLSHRYRKLIQLAGRLERGGAVAVGAREGARADG